jgi:hypothetical protein
VKGRTILLAATAALAPCAPARAGEGQAYLLSIAEIALAPREYVDRFSIDTWEVEILAICRLPPGWTITAGKDATPTGSIGGEASHGVTFLDAARLSELQDMALIALDGPVDWQPHGTIPATFAGHAEVGIYGTGDDLPRRRIAFTAANLRLTPAAGCPTPRR